DYLGLARHPLVTERLAHAARSEGCGSTGSRLLRGHREVFGAVEQQFAAFKGSARSLYFSSGCLANLAVVPRGAIALDGSSKGRAARSCRSPTRSSWPI